MHRAGAERQHLAVAEVEAVRVQAHARRGVRRAGLRTSAGDARCAASLREHAREHAASARMSSSSRGARGSRAPSAIVGSTNGRNDGLLLHAIDEDEAPGVLELALHGHQVELAPELGARRGVERRAARA